MRRVIIKAAIAVCLLILALGIYLVGCSKKGLEPVEYKIYYAYFGDQKAPNQYFRYNTTTFEVDTFELPYDSYYDGFCISPDGKTMYLHPDDGIVEVSLDSFVVMAEHPIYLPKNGSTGDGHEVIISPHGRYLAMLNRYLHIVDLTDYSVVYLDTTTLAVSGWFTNDSKTFFCAVPGPDRTEALEVLMDETPEIRRHIFEAGALTKIMTSADNRLWFLMLYAGDGFSVFQVHDTETDSIIYSYSRCPGSGSMAISTDGRFVAYSRPGNMLGWCSLYPYITIYDVAGNRIEREVSTFDDSIGAALAINGLWITPDGRHLFGISDSYNLEGHAFQYNLIYHKVENIFKTYPPGRMLFSLRGQKQN
jgi:hypothetical protein